MKDYPNALSYFEKTFCIRQKTLPGNHPDMTTTKYNSIAGVSFQLKYYTKALQATETSFPLDHPDIVDAREWIKVVEKEDKTSIRTGWKPAEKIKAPSRIRSAPVKLPPIPAVQTIRSGLRNPHAKISHTGKDNLPTNSFPRSHTGTRDHSVRRMNRTVKKPVGAHFEVNLYLFLIILPI